jgi:single-strand DNA-binding protein
MAVNSNSITITGNLTRDPELRYTGGGQAKAALSVAVNRRWQNRQSQEWEEQTSFFDVVAWGELAEHIADSLSKGSRVLVTGRLEQRSWDNQEGVKQYRTEIVADEVGPSLRFATAQVTRAERRDGGGPGGGGGAGGGGGPRSGGGGGSGGSGGGGRPSAPADPVYDDDEEPF